MRNIILAVFLLLGLCISSAAYAADAGDRGDIPTTPETGGSCDFQKFKEDLGARESGGNYQAKNSYGYLGKYQFGKAALQDLDFITDNGNWSGMTGTWNGQSFGPINSEQDFLNSPAAQEYAMDKWADQMNKEIQAAGLEQYIGKTIPGCNVPITRSGLLAGRHLKGIGCKLNEAKTGCASSGGTLALRAWLESNGAINPTDGYGTSVAEYVCKFSGYSTPYDSGQTATECGGGVAYPGKPGAGKTPDSDPDGDGGYQPRLDLMVEGIQNNWIYGLMLMAEQFSVNMEKQLEGIGMLFDAKEQAEAQRDFQRLTAQAHKDYHPSEQMCTFGTFSMNLASTERLSNLTRNALSQEVLQRELGSGDSKGKTAEMDTLSRIKLFRDKFCNPKDNGGGLDLLCTKETKPEMQNRDINYTQTIDQPLTLDVNLTDTTTTDDETAIFALIDYLFMHDSMPIVPETPLEQQGFQFHYQNMRSIVAMRGIARNSFANIVALKTASPDQAEKSGPYLKALMKEMGLSNDEIEKLLGKNPSYYAQMEFLTKTIYQNPNFYSNLYDKPVNVDRIRAAMQAIKLMNDRDIHASIMRREMLLSMILELKLRERAEKVYDDTENTMFK